MGWRLLAATLATAVLAIAGLVIGASPASAHNVLKSTSPADGKNVARTPSSVVLTFDEPAIALGTKLVITGPEGPVQIGKPSAGRQHRDAGSAAGFAGRGVHRGLAGHLRRRSPDLRQLHLHG